MPGVNPRHPFACAHACRTGVLQRYLGRRQARGGVIYDSLALAQKPYGENVGIGAGGP